MRTGPSNRGRWIAAGALAICALLLVGRLVQSRLPWVVGGPSRLSPDGRLVVLGLITVSALTGAMGPVGKPSAANGRHAVEAAALSRDGTTILGTQGNGERSDGAIDVVTLSYHDGRPRVLVRHAIQPSWNR